VWEILTFVITLFDLGYSNETIETIIDLVDSVLSNIYFAAVSPQLPLSTNLFNVCHPSN